MDCGTITIEQITSNSHLRMRRTNMITVTNRINFKKGFAEKMAPMFTSNKDLLKYEGFHKVEVLVSTQNEEYDEMQVVMYWDSQEAFAVWRNSDDFKNSHKGGGSGESPVLGSQIIIAEVASTLVK